MDNSDIYAARKLYYNGASIKAIAKELDVTEEEVAKELCVPARKTNTPFGWDYLAENKWREEWDYWRNVINNAISPHKDKKDIKTENLSSKE